MSLSVIKEHIEITPGVCGGKPRIAGHRIRVQDIVVWHEQMGMSPDEILYHYPSITLSDVYAALAYYYDHRDEIRQQMEESSAMVREIQANTPSILQDKCKDSGGGGLTRVICEAEDSSYGEKPALKTRQ